MYKHEEGKIQSVHIAWDQFPIEGETIYCIISEDVDNINKYGFMTAKDLRLFLNIFCSCNTSMEAYHAARLEILINRYHMQGMSFGEVHSKAVREIESEERIRR